MINIIILIPE